MPKKNLPVLSSKFFLFLTLFTLSSCLGSKQDGASQIRIVDLNGNPKPIKRFVPEGNAQILASQKNAMQINEINKSNINSGNINSGNINSGNINPADNNLAQNNTRKPTNNLNDLPAGAPTNPSEAAAQPEAIVLYDMSNEASANSKPYETASAPKVNRPNSSNNITPSTSSSAGKKFVLAAGSSKTSKDKVLNKTSANKSGIFIQIGSFSAIDNANKILSKSNKISKGIVQEIELGDKKSYRVLLGPITNQKKANHILKQAKNSGYKDAFIVK